ncbi:MAG: hypothetical protein Q4C04_08580 [Clostridia bacterium]|nr:hypothetical protein [Clostridia bacterium]
MTGKSRFKHTRRALIFWCFFIGIGAVAGATGMLVDPSGKTLGMDAMLPYFEKLPFSEQLFSDFTFPGIALLFVNGLTNLTAAVLLLKRRRAGIVLGGVFGVTLMLWICIQFYMFPPNFMSSIYFVFGLIQAVTGYMAWVFFKQESFSFDTSAYPNVGSNPKLLVVYFSRMGYTKKVAYEAANESGAEIFAVRAKERTEGTLGFWMCGRYAMHRWAMPIEEVGIELESYERVTICSPIWAFGLSAPIRSFCSAARGRIRSADYIIVHYMRAKLLNAAFEMDELLGLKGRETRSLCCREGRMAQAGCRR